MKLAHLLPALWAASAATLAIAATPARPPNIDFIVADDLGWAETTPDRVRELDRLIQAHLDDAQAVAPLPNPAFDHARYEPGRIGVQPGGLKIAGAPEDAPAAVPKKKRPAARSSPP